jgi:hypothetical protein
MLVRGVREHQVGQHPDPAIRGSANELLDVAQAAQPWVDVVVVGHVVAVVAPRRGEERKQPHRRHSKAGQVVDAAGQAGEVADAVPVGVLERLDIDAVDNRVLVPEVTRRFAAHPGPSSLFPSLPADPTSDGWAGASRSSLVSLAADHTAAE